MGKILSTTDATGVYQAEALTHGDYTVRLRVPEGQRAGGFLVDGRFEEESVQTVHLKAEQLRECDFQLVAK